jgi:hypothetical protein
MDGISQSTDVDVPLDVARQAWNTFIEWIRVGNYRFACDAMTCERAADGETVRFEPLDTGGTRVRVDLSVDAAGDPDPSRRERLLADFLQRDLLRFKDYLRTDFRAHHLSAKASGPAAERPEVFHGIEKPGGGAL